MKTLFYTGIFLLLIAVIISCEKENDLATSFKLVAEFDSIRSCPNGGGIFILKVSETDENAGDIQLNVEASSDLNALRTKYLINKESPVSEIIIKPIQDIEIKDYIIKVNASNPSCDTVLNLYVNMFDWPSEIGEDALLKRDEYIAWLEDNYLEYNIKANQEWFAYLTYPQILIVEHITFLNDLYEFRLCRHAMIPPYDWSMIRLRKRNEAEPFFAAKQDSSGGNIHQISIEEYPEMFGY